MQQVADEEILIQRLTSEALLNEAEAERLVFETSAEQAQAQAELEKAEAEYQKALQDVIDQQETNIALINASDPMGVQLNQEQETIAIDEQSQILYKESEELYLKRRKADELQALGLIPMDATTDQMAGYVDLITQQEAEKPTFLTLSQTGDLIATVGGAEEEVKIRKHKALVKAHNEFQKKYKKEIMEFRYGFKRATPQYENDVMTTLDDIVYVEYGKQYLPFGSPTNKNPRDGKLFRVNQRIVPSSFAPNEKTYIEYVYDPANNVWNQQGEWVNELDSNSITSIMIRDMKSSDLNLAKFTIDGRFPEAVEIPFVKESGFSGLVAMFRRGFVQGKWNTKRAYQKCKPGYWFFEELPEEASHCVYMGGTMVDSDASYYPASVGFDYRKGETIANPTGAVAVRQTGTAGKKLTEEEYRLLDLELAEQQRLVDLEQQQQEREEAEFRRSQGINF